MALNFVINSVCACVQSINFVRFYLFQAKIQTFGGAKRKANDQCFYYGGADKQRRVLSAGNVPTFDSLTKNRMLMERRYYLNNSNSKYISMGIVPATKMLDSDARGFHFEAVLAGEKSFPLPLGGLEGMSSLFRAIREIPAFSRVLPTMHGIAPSENIEISTGFDFAKNVCCIISFLCYFLFNTFSTFVSVLK